MAYKEALRVESEGVIRRWQAGSSQRQIAEGTGLSRAAVRKYPAAAKGEGIAQGGPAPSEERLSRLAGISRAGRGKWRRRLRTAWLRGLTRSTSGSPATG